MSFGFKRAVADFGALCNLSLSLMSAARWP